MSRVQPVHAGAQGADHGQQVDQQPRSPYLTSAQALGYLQLATLSALYSHMRDNGLPYARLGRALRFDTRELDVWMKRHRDPQAAATRPTVTAAKRLSLVDGKGQK